MSTTLGASYLGMIVAPAQSICAGGIPSGAPVLIGVKHELDVRDATDELAMVDSFLEARSPRSIGLELPEDHEQRRSWGITNFFYEVNKRHAGVSLAALDDSQSLNRWYQTQIAKALTEGSPHAEVLLKSDIYSLQEQLKQPPDPWKPPEMSPNRDWMQHHLSILRGALALVSADLSNEKLTDLWWKRNHERTDHMLARIRSHSPEVVIVGNGHAKLLAPQLPSYIHMFTPMAQNMNVEMP